MKLAHVYGNLPVDPKVFTTLKNKNENRSSKVNKHLKEYGVTAWDYARWAPKIKDFWWPLRNVGLVRNRDSPRQMILSTGVGSHVDKFTDLSVCYVIHNDDFTFETKYEDQILTCQPKAGDWFLFDDHLFHALTKSKKKKKDWFGAFVFGVKEIGGDSRQLRLKLET